ncbi:MAG: peptidoglycan endopeptidase [Treponema sp.]|nr:peptidoglycan endopeptidase [Treponema sp.]
MKNAAFVWLAVNLFLYNVPFIHAQEEYLFSFSDPVHLWGNGVERVIEEAYRQCFTTRIIDGRVMNIRLPFAMMNERDIMLETPIPVFAGGKGSPQTLMPVIDEILDSEGFAEYINAFSSRRERALLFDLQELTWTFSSDIFIIARLKAGTYRILPHRPHILTSGRGAQETDVHNYLYCIGLVGIDCSGFVWHILSYIGARGGTDLGRIISPALGLPRGADPALYAGTSFFSSQNPQLIDVSDEIRNLRPADILLFRDTSGTVVHSAIIQSIDYARGVIRYLQCTNVAPAPERGVHESFIYFDPANPSVSLKDPSLHWTQRRAPSFPGEEVPFANDGDYFRNRANGGGRVVRLRALIPVIERMGWRE